MCSRSTASIYLFNLNKSLLYMLFSTQALAALADLQVAADTTMAATPPVALSVAPPAQEAMGSVDGSFLPGSLWDLIGHAQGFEWPLGALFVLGIFLLTSAYVRYFRQWRGSDEMLQLDPRGITEKDLALAVERAKPQNPYRLAGDRLLEEFGRRGSAQSMIDYTVRYIDFDHDNYLETERYITAAVYIALSLGLLGTLLGIFVLFMAGSRHEASDLVGLGIAVVSTMLALVVRLILWPVNIFLQASVRKRYKTLKKWTVALAYALAGGK